MNNPVAGSALETLQLSAPRRRSVLTLVFFLLVAWALYRGWILRSEGYLTAERGVGYILGIVGASMMLALLLYPVRKHLRSLRNFGAIRYWFWAHMVLGVLGPTLILFHANFSFGSLNSNVALVCMLLVASSGIIGRFLYSRIHYGLYGRRATQAELSLLARQNREKLNWGEELDREVSAGLDLLDQVTARLAGRDRASFAVWFRETRRARAIRNQLKKNISRSLRRRATDVGWSGADFRSHRRDSIRYLKGYFAASQKFQELDFYARLFALWHVVHLPFFYMMILAAVVHVVAVHVY
ncbi:hypothetical protein [Congregibacter sp.]|uniref:hypothetical protein n=1 Tax=Congregibacter sp. TaxID=2744308 RepID=UPI003F6B30A0